MNLEVERISPHVVRVAVPAKTLPPLNTTNTYIIQDEDKAVIVDCASTDETTSKEIIRIIQTLGLRHVVAYVATHYHPDHTQGIPLLQAELDAPIYIHPLDAGNAAESLQCDAVQLLIPPSAWHLGDVVITATHHPGHTHGHLHIFVKPDDVILVGDHMAGIGSVWIGPPDGHMEDYYQALRQISHSGAQLALPGHGPVIHHPARESERLLKHRQSREEQICNYLENGGRTLDEIVSFIYKDRSLGPAWPFARRTIQAHLAHLMNQDLIHRYSGPPDFRIYYGISQQRGVHC